MYTNAPPLKYCAGAYKDYLNKYGPTNRNDLIARFVNERTTLQDKIEAIPFYISEEGMIEEVTNFLFAGTDTNGNSLFYLFWELPHTPDWVLKLRAEMREACGDQSSPPYSSISDLPVMDAVTYELWRL